MVANIPRILPAFNYGYIKTVVQCERLCFNISLCFRARIPLRISASTERL